MNKIIDVSDFQNVNDRTLLLGKTKSGNTRHIYMKGGEINIIEYKKEPIFVNNPIEPKGYIDKGILSVGADALKTNRDYIPKGFVVDEAICPEFRRILESYGLSLERETMVKNANVSINRKTGFIAKTQEEIEAKKPEKVLAKIQSLDSYCNNYAKPEKYNDLKELSFSLYKFVLNKGLEGYDGVKVDGLANKQFEVLRKMTEDFYPEFSSLSPEDFFYVCQDNNFYEEVSNYLDTIQNKVNKLIEEKSSPEMLPEVVNHLFDKHKKSIKDIYLSESNKIGQKNTL